MNAKRPSDVIDHSNDKVATKKTPSNMRMRTESASKNRLSVVIAFFFF